MLSTCSLKGGWKAHKIQYKIAAQSVSGAQPRAAPVGSFTQLNELLRVGARYTMVHGCREYGPGSGVRAVLSNDIDGVDGWLRKASGKGYADCRRCGFAILSQSRALVTCDSNYPRMESNLRRYRKHTPQH
jgi:hypothetical protein